MINATMNNLFTAQEIEEAINTLATFKRYMSGGGVVDIKANKAIDMAIEVLKAPPITQRSMYQAGYRQGREDALQADIVWCEECEHKADNYCYKHSHEVTDSDFCSYGERRDR